MCEFQGVPIGERISFEATLTCDGCGYTALQTVSGTYQGHIYQKRYGNCDVIQRSPVVSCPECGVPHYQVVTVCGGGGNIFDAILNQSVEVKGV